ncbi:MAG: hypothetical protein NVSMB6_05710 [Burkholderiaceae bacterium]
MIKGLPTLLCLILLATSAPSVALNHSAVLASTLSERASLEQRIHGKPGDTGALKSLFYLDVQEHRLNDAVVVGRKYHFQRPADDTFTLDLAYALLESKATVEATSLLSVLTHSRDKKVAAAASTQLASEDQEVQSSGSQLLANAERQSSAGNNIAAAQSYRLYLHDNPLDARTWLALAYIDGDLGRHAEALSDLDRHLSLLPGDPPASLQRGYELDELGRSAEALDAFRALQTSTDPDVAKKARTEIAARLAAGREAKGSVFGYAEHESRFSDMFYGTDVSYNLSSGHRIIPYAVLHFTSDTHSGVPDVSEVFQDNAAVFNVGVKTPLGHHATAFVEAGYGFGLRLQPSVADLRAGVNYYTETSLKKGAHTVLDASVVHYSRFGGNNIGYASLTRDFPLMGRLRGVVGANLAADSRREFFNNFGETFGGVQYGLHGLTLRVVHVYGVYLDRGTARPAVPGYSTTRPMLMFGFEF